MNGQERVSLPLHLHAPLLARMHVHQVGQTWPADLVDLMDAAVLATSELVANAVQYAAGDLTLVIQVVAGTVRVEVHDEGDPIIRTAVGDRCVQEVELEAECGRGLFIVDAVADRWGMSERGPSPGKAVWFELDRPAIDLAAKAPLRDVS